MKSALILIDIQNDYFPGGAMELAGMTQAAARARELLAAFRQARRPIFHVQHLALGPGATFFRPETPGVEINESVRPLPGEALVRKHYPNAFRDTGLLEVLQGAGVEEVIICRGHEPHVHRRHHPGRLRLRLYLHRHPRRLRHPGPGLRGRTIPAAQVHGAFMAALGMRYARVVALKEFFEILCQHS